MTTTEADGAIYEEETMGMRERVEEARSVVGEDVEWLTNRGLDTQDNRYHRIADRLQLLSSAARLEGEEVEVYCRIDDPDQKTEPVEEVRRLVYDIDEREPDRLDEVAAMHGGYLEYAMTMAVNLLVEEGHDIYSLIRRHLRTIRTEEKDMHDLEKRVREIERCLNLETYPEESDVLGHLLDLREKVDAIIGHVGLEQDHGATKEQGRIVLREVSGG